MKEIKVKYEKLERWQRFGLKITKVPKALVESGYISTNDIEVASLFGLLCLLAAMVALFQSYLFAQKILSLPNYGAFIIALMYGIAIFFLDRRLFRDSLKSGRFRLLLVGLSTFVFAFGTSLYINESEIKTIIMNEDKAHRLEQEKYYNERLQTAQRQVDDAERQKLTALVATNNGQTTKASDNINTLYDRLNALPFASGEDSAKIVQSRKDIQQQINKVSGFAKVAEKTNDQITKQSEGIVALAKENYQKESVEIERLKKDMGNVGDSFTVGRMLSTLVNHLKDLGAGHIIAFFLILCVEVAPFLYRITHDDYNITYALMVFAQTPINQLHLVLPNLEEHIEALKNNLYQQSQSKRANTTDDDEDDSGMEQIF